MTKPIAIKFNKYISRKTGFNNNYIYKTLARKNWILNYKKYIFDIKYKIFIRQ